MKERAADIRDVSKRVLSHILGVELPNPSMIDESVVIVGNDLTPSDTAQLNKRIRTRFCYKHWRKNKSLCNYESFFRNSSNCWYKINYSRS